MNKEIEKSLHRDIIKWNLRDKSYKTYDVWRPDIKILDEEKSISKIVEIVGDRGKQISFGHVLFEMIFSIKLPKT